MNEPAAELCRPAPGGWKTAGLTTRAPAARAGRPRPCQQPPLGPPTAPTHSLPSTAVLPDCRLSETSPAPKTLPASTVPRPPRSPRVSLFAQDLPSILSLPGCLQSRGSLQPSQLSAYPLTSPFRTSLSLLPPVTPTSHPLSTGRFPSPALGYQGSVIAVGVPVRKKMLFRCLAPLPASRG